VAGVIVEVVILKKAKTRNIFIINIFNIIEYIVSLDGLKRTEDDKNISDDN
jgi:hypothetical protein